MAEVMTADQKAKAKLALRSIAETEYKKISKSIIFMEEYKDEIKMLVKTGHPWTVIAMKLEAITKTKISATTLRNYFKRPELGEKNKRLPSVDAAPNPFAQNDINLETPPGFDKLIERENREGMNS